GKHGGGGGLHERRVAGGAADDQLLRLTARDRREAERGGGDDATGASEERTSRDSGFRHRVVSLPGRVVDDAARGCRHDQYRPMPRAPRLSVTSRSAAAAPAAA